MRGGFHAILLLGLSLGGCSGDTSPHSRELNIQQPSAYAGFVEVSAEEVSAAEREYAQCLVAGVNSLGAPVTVSQSDAYGIAANCQHFLSPAVDARLARIEAGVPLENRTGFWSAVSGRDYVEQEFQNQMLRQISTHIQPLIPA